MSPMRLIILVGAAMAAMALRVRNMAKPTTVTEIVPEIQTQVTEVS